MKTVQEVMDYLSTLASTDSVMVIMFLVDDVYSRAKELGEELTHEEAVEVLRIINEEEDSSNGTCWDNLDNAIIDIVNGRD